MKLHRNSQKRIYGDFIYAITCDVSKKFPYFKNNILCKIWLEHLKIAKKYFNFQMFAFCLNYEHFHLLIKPENDIANYSQIMHFIKKNTSQNINKILGFTAMKLPPKYAKNKIKEILKNDVVVPSKNGVVVSRKLKNDSPEGDDSNRSLRVKLINNWLIKMRNNFVKTQGENHDFPKFKWQKSFHDHVIRNKYDFDNQWKYIMYNYGKHKLPQDWQYTGLKHADIIDKIDMV